MGIRRLSYHAALARVFGVLTLRFAQGYEDFDLAAYAARIQGRIKYLQGLADDAHMGDLKLKGLAASADNFLETIQSEPSGPNAGIVAMLRPGAAPVTSEAPAPASAPTDARSAGIGG